MLRENLARREGLRESVLEALVPHILLYSQAKLTSDTPSGFNF